ncbi:putative dolichol phosphate-mannose biosynthesis regulatory protein (DPM2) [Lyophyllum shimeji]|uniref:Dolichol phosphate-mannose biosynthesis regulatory protein n=1 Tax=Lyophyllum shimeji TaxID=47721 RepID=A0A9P3UL16_LYOSH|nr:putative dolichol phosphate-mannose biosynthesis regulatory protein (DPM2) [Lyophyllum shimeji]
MGASDKALGGSMLLAAVVVFTYYTTWALLLPFFDSSSQIHNFFPPREWAVMLPAFVLVLGLSAIGLERKDCERRKGCYLAIRPM